MEQSPGRSPVRAVLVARPRALTAVATLSAVLACDSLALARLDMLAATLPPLLRQPIVAGLIALFPLAPASVFRAISAAAQPEQGRGSPTRRPSAFRPHSTYSTSASGGQIGVEGSSRAVAGYGLSFKQALRRARRVSPPCSPHQATRAS